MRSYKHLYEDFISKENIWVAIHNASKGKRDRRQVMPYINDVEGSVPSVVDYVEHFENAPHVMHRINERGRGKERDIVVPTFKEQIVHHMVVNTLRPVMMRGMYDHSYGSIPCRGIHLAKKRIEKWLSKDRKNAKYFLKMDIHHFFASIPHDRLKAFIGRYVRDEKVFSIVCKIIDVLPQGLPLGFYTSQWFANWYLQPLDHFIKERLHAKYYVRYMDDMVVFGSNKRKLHRMRVAIEEYLATLGLELNPSWFVARFVYTKDGKEYGRDLDFMGFRFFRTRTTLRRTIMLRATRLARRMNGSILDAHRFMSYIGWFTHSDTYNVFCKWIRPYLSVRRLRLQIGRADRRSRYAVV